MIFCSHFVGLDDFGDVMLDELVNLVEGFFDQHENRNAVECAQSTTDIQISKESSAGQLFSINKSLIFRNCND